VLSNHDVDRHVSRYGRPDTSFDMAARDHSQPVDAELGTRRARAAVLLTMALPGAVYVYQGEELGLGEVEDILGELRQDPIWHRTGGADPGRDGSRVPLPWSGDAPPFGFSNLSPAPVSPPEHVTVLLASGPLPAGSCRQIPRSGSARLPIRGNEAPHGWPLHVILTYSVRRTWPLRSRAAR
jgi:Alpha amylase, catalytic domain